MRAAKVNHKKKADNEREAPLKGTWISVGVLGFVILATYVLVYGLYMARV